MSWRRPPPSDVGCSTARSESGELCIECCPTPSVRCSIEAVLRVDDRGQILLPKELREKTGIKAGDKLVAISSSRGDEVCCITLIPAERIRENLKLFLGPFLRELMETS